MRNMVSAALLAVSMAVSIASAGVVSKDGIAKDSATGLMWQDTREVITVKKDWRKAKQYCQDLRLGGYRDWRLPNVFELLTLRNDTLEKAPYILNGFKNLSAEDYWSASEDDVEHAGVVNYRWTSGVGLINGYRKNTKYIRCVRLAHVNYETFMLLVNDGKVEIPQDKLSMFNLKLYDDDEKAIRAKEQAEKERQAEYDRKHACDGFYPGKNFKVHTTGLLGGDEEAVVTGLDKESGQVSFKWYDGNSWRPEETTCSYLKTQMR